MISNRIKVSDLVVGATMLVREKAQGFSDWSRAQVWEVSEVFRHEDTCDLYAVIRVAGDTTNRTSKTVKHQSLYMSYYKTDREKLDAFMKSESKVPEAKPPVKEEKGPDPIKFLNKLQVLSRDLAVLKDSVHYMEQAIEELLAELKS